MASMESVMKEIADEISVEVAEELKREMCRLCSVPGNPKQRAKRYAPPRRISGRLLRGITRRKNKISVEAPYAWFLEYRTGGSFPHKFLEPALKKLGLL
jgi:hypothetical protein